MSEAKRRPGPEDWTIECTIPTLSVPDLKLGLDFYEKLGFEVDWRWPEDEPSHAGSE